MPSATVPSEDHAIRKALREFLRGGNAHATIADAVKDFPADQYGEKTAGSPHSAWQLLEHIRITLHDLLDFCRNPNYHALQWPEEYWPKHDAPANADAWSASAKELQQDLGELETLIADSSVDLTARIPWGKGQTILREILLAGDHTSYHAGQLILLRKQLGIWNG